MIAMLGTIGLMGCGAIICAVVSAAAAAASGIASAVIQSKAADAQKAATAKAETRQRQSQQAQLVSDRKQANAVRQQAAYGVLLARIDTRQTVNETNAINRKLAARASTSSSTSRVLRGSYHSGTPAE